MADDGPVAEAEAITLAAGLARQARNALTELGHNPPPECEHPADQRGTVKVGRRHVEVCEACGTRFH